MSRQRKEEKSEALRIGKSAMAIVRHHAGKSGRPIKAQISYIIKQWAESQVPARPLPDDFQDLIS